MKSGEIPTIATDPHDDELRRFAEQGAPALPAPASSGYVEHDGARIWHAVFGAEGPAVILLHGGLGHSGNWGHQVPALVQAGYRVVTIDSRGHGRSTRDARPYRYEQMAADTRAVMDHLGLDRAALVGWSDGACTALILSAQTPARATGVFFFGCNMDPGGTKPFVPTPVIDRCFARHMADYAALSATPGDFKAFTEAVGQMQCTEPNYTAAELAAIRVPVTIVHAEHDEFIKREHADHLAWSIPGATFTMLPGVSHFAPLQRPASFNAALIQFLRGV